MRGGVDARSMVMSVVWQSRYYKAIKLLEWWRIRSELVVIGLGVMVVRVATAAVTAEKRLGMTLMVVKVVKMAVDDGVYISNGGDF